MKRLRLSTLALLLAVLALLVLRYAFDVSWAGRAAGALLIATLVIRWGLASLRPMQVGTKNYDPVDVVEPDGLPVFSCSGCGTQLLLLRKGNEKPPRHCGEPMRYAVIPGDEAGVPEYPAADFM
ncbi:MAG: hypothetical protein ABI912_06460 [Actinomycetota bacterium]